MVVDDESSIGKFTITEKGHEGTRDAVHLVAGVEQRVQELRTNDDLVSSVTRSEVFGRYDADGRLDWLSHY